MNSRTLRRAYLVTYSQADREKFPDRQYFGEAVKAAFDNGSGKVKTSYWACCLEHHEDGGDYFHVSIKLTGPKRWPPAKHLLMQNHGVSVHFSDDHDSYYDAYQCVCKSDSNVYHSADHPNFKELGLPKTRMCIKATRNKRKGKQSVAQTDDDTPSCSKAKRSPNLGVSEFIVGNDVHTETELLARAQELKQAGKRDLTDSCVNCSGTSLEEQVSIAGKMEKASPNASNAKQSCVVSLCHVNPLVGQHPA